MAFIIQATKVYCFQNSLSFDDVAVDYILLALLKAYLTPLKTEKADDDNSCYSLFVVALSDGPKHNVLSI